MDFPKLIDEYLANLQLASSPYTYKNYKHYLSEFLKIHPEEKGYILRFNQHLSKKGLSQETKNYHLIALRSFLEYLKTKGLAVPEKTDIKLGSHKKPTKTKLEKEIIDRLIAAPKDDLEGLRDKALMALLQHLKVSQVYPLNRDASLNVDVDTYLTIERYKTARKDTDPALFIRLKGRSTNLRLSIRSIERIVKKYSKKLGNIQATPQILRDSF